MIDAGFTTVRNVGHSAIDGDISLRDAIRSGWVPGPRIAASGRKIAPYGGQALRVQAGVVQALVDQEFLAVSSPAEGRRAVLENLRAGADSKVVVDDWPRVIDEDTLNAIADEAHRVAVRVAAHATTKLGIQAAIAAGVDSIEHGDDATDEQFQAMHDKGIVLVPTLWPRDLLPIPRALRARPDLDRVLDSYVAGERTKLDRARKAGVKIAFGSDNWFGFGDETRGEATRLVLEALETFGMSPADVLRAATVDAAVLLNMSDEVGALEAGKYADLIAVDGDPLATARALDKVRFVMKDGAVIRDDFHASAGAVVR
jgi:imidazolonepropionase-like amidohydrolase